MKKYLVKSRKFILYCALLLIDAINVALMAVLLKQTLDAAISGDIKKLLTIAVTIIIFMLEYSFISWCLRTVKAYYISEVMFALKADLVSAILGKSVKEFSNQNSAEYISLFNNDLKMIEDNYITSVFSIYRNAVVLLVSLAIMLSIQPVVSLVAIIMSFLPILIPKLCGKKLSCVTETYTEHLKKYNRFVDNVFRGFEVIKNDILETYMDRKHEQENHAVENARRDLGKVKANVDVLTNFVAVGMQFAVFVISGVFMILKKITAGDVFAITQLMSKVAIPVFDMIDSLNKIQSVKSIESNILMIVKDNERMEKHLVAAAEPISIEKISLKNVSFSYADHAEVLQNISLKFEKGKKYAIVGESGSGKSTLMKLLQGYFDDYSGEIYFDSVNAAELNQEELFRVFSVMSQNVFLFEGTMRENIGFDQNVSEDVWHDVLEKVKLNDTLQKKGIDLSCMLWNNGENLSGGEREKIALARALLRNKSWLLFDEATASMDNETLIQIERMLADLAGITCITITHRYKEEVLSKFDELIVLKKGKVVERGTFEELRKGKGTFHKLYQGES